MIRPERRTRGDLLAAAAIAAVVALILTAVWWHSSVRSTEFRPAAGSAAIPVAANSVLGVLQQRWTASSARTSAPVVIGGTVVTADGRTMAGAFT